MFTGLLNKTVTIQEKALTQTTSGAKIESWTTKETAKARFTRNTSAKVIDGLYKVTTEDFIFFFDIGTDVKRADRILASGNYYNVITVVNFDGYANAHHLEVYASIYDGDIS